MLEKEDLAKLSLPELFTQFDSFVAERPYLQTQDCPNCYYDRNPADAKVCEVCETPLPQQNQGASDK